MKRIIYFLLTILSASSLVAQSDIKQIDIEARKQKTANTHDILTNFYKAGIDNLLGTKHSFTFNSTFFGIDSLFNRKRDNIKHEFGLRSNSLNFTIKGDSSNSIIGYSGGFTFTLVNKRDVVYSKIDKNDLEILQKRTNEFADLKKKIQSNIAEKYRSLSADTSIQRKTSDSLQKIVNTSFAAAEKAKDYSILDGLIIKELKDIITQTGDENAKSLLSGKDFFHQAYVEIATKYSRKPLWTLSPNFGYDIQKKQGNYSLASNFIVGFGAIDKKAWEIEANATFRIESDSTVQKVNYDNKPFSISLGINKVLLENSDKESKMELKFFTQFDHQFGKVSDVSDTNKFTLNSIFRVNVYKSLWLPITVKYDPSSGNFLGIFSITANLGN